MKQSGRDWNRRESEVEKRRSAGKEQGVSSREGWSDSINGCLKVYWIGAKVIDNIYLSM